MLGGESDLQLGADPIGARDQQRIAVTGGGQVEQAAIAANLGRGAGSRSGAGEWPDGLDQRRTGGDVDSRVLVGVGIFGNAAPRSRCDSPLEYGAYRAEYAALNMLNILHRERFAMATMVQPRRLGVLLILVIGGLIVNRSAVGAVAVDPAFTIAGVAVDVTAEDATMARIEALAQGQRLSFRRLLERLVSLADYDRLPTPPVPVITELVRGFEVADERVGPDRYIASLTFHFKPQEVGRLLRDYNIPYAASASEPIIVLPLFRRSGELMLWEDGNPWRAAWARLTPSNSLVPVIVPFGELVDMEIISAVQAEAGDRERLDRLSERYGAGEAIIIDAVESGISPAGGPRVAVTVRRFQGPGVRVAGGTYDGMMSDSLEQVLALAAMTTRGQLEDEWKEANLLRFDRESSLAIDIPLKGISDWLDIRDRLAGITLIRKLEITALSPRFARAVLHYLGDDQQLIGALARNDLSIVREADFWLLYRRGEGDDRAGESDFSASSTIITPDTVTPLIVPGEIGPDTIVIE